MCRQKKTNTWATLGIFGQDMRARFAGGQVLRNNPVSAAYKPLPKFCQFLFLLTIFLLFCKPGYAQSLQHQSQCVSLTNSETNALQTHDWNRLITLSRQALSYCLDTMVFDQQALTLNFLAVGLEQTSQFQDALPIARRCASIKPDATYCYVEIAASLEGLGQIEDAVNAYRKAVNLGGYDEVSAGAIVFAKARLQFFEIVAAEDAAKKRNAEDAAERRNAAIREEGPIVVSGTGFYVSSLGHILTNRHVVDGCHNITTRDKQPLALVLLSGTADLALLKQDKHPSVYATFRSGLGIRVGDEVMAFGFPLPGILSSEGNISIGTVAANSGIGDDPQFIQISAPVQPGNSGGPLLDLSENVVGVVVAKLDAIKIAQATGDIPENVNFSISRDVVIDFLRNSAVPFQQKPSQVKLKPPDVATFAKNISVSITCVK
jgi:S1-C subfamily serine protease